MKKEISYLYGLIGGSILILTIILTSCFNTYTESQTTNSSYKLKSNSTISYNTDNFIFLSDIPFDKEKSNTSTSTISLDELASGATFSLKFGPETIHFLKGIYAHATSTVVYNLKDLDYDYFESYIGLNTHAESTDGVKIFIYTSMDGENWTLETEEEPETILSSHDAKKVKISLKNAKYLKLYAYDNGNNKNDFVVYANAKLTNEGYKELSDSIKTTSEYDEIIKNNYKNGLNIEEYEHILLQREFVQRVGYTNLQIISSASDTYINTINWLINDSEALNKFLFGGTPSDSYTKTIKILSELYSKHKDDLNNKDAKISNINLNLMLAIALTHSKEVKSWISPTEESNPLERYEIYQYMYLQNKLNNSIFENLSVEEMRLVVNNSILNEEIEWLHDYTESSNKRQPKNPNSYITNKNNYDYNLSKFYDPLEKSKWQSIYNLDSYNITYENNLPRLWMAFEGGGTTNDIINTGTNINASDGIPSIIINQPNHKAYMTLNIDETGKRSWTIENDIYGISKSIIDNRLPYGWEQIINTNNKYNASYIYLIQESLNNLDKHTSSEKKLILADIIEDNTLKEHIIKEAIEIEPLNFNAWYKMIDLYKNNSYKEEEAYTLLTELSNTFTYHPLPMYDLMSYFESKFTTTTFKLKYSMLLKETLKKSTLVTNFESNTPAEIKSVGEYLLNILNTEIVSFSFDNNKIVISDQILESENISWEYSLDNQKSWTKVNTKEHLLTNTELSSISETTDIKIHIVGTNYNDENIYTIDIKKSEKKNDIYNNDLENILFGIDETIEWKYNDEDSWKTIEETPNLEGDKTIYIRTRAHDVYLPSEITKYTFTNNNFDKNKNYIPLKRIKIFEHSESENDSQIQNIIDGNIYTSWISKIQSDSPYIILKLDKPTYISSLEYIPKQTNNDGRIKDVEIYTSTNLEDWSRIHTSTFEDSYEPKNIDFTVSKEALYIKIVATSNYGNAKFISGSMINLYEDTTKKVIPETQLEYNIINLTNNNVVAKVTSKNHNITFTNEGGNTHIFEKNGEFTFTFQDEYGNTGKQIAKVDWIDKEKPTANIYYDITTPTNKDVTVHISGFSEDITILNNTGSTSYTFKENGEFSFQIRDLAGNESTIATKVDWIDRTKPNAIIEYSTIDITDQPVIARLIQTDKDFTIINNKASSTYKFTDNGEFTFMIRDKAGNENSITASVNWIKKTDNTENDCYVTTDTNDIIDESDNENDNNIITKDENSYKTFTIDNITLEIPAISIKDGTEVNLKKLIIDDNFKEEVGNQSKSFELYLTNGNTKMDIKGDIKITIGLDSDKTLLGVYSTSKNNTLQSLKYNFPNENSITFNTKELGEFIISYGDVEEKQDIKNFNYYFYILIALIIASFGYTIYRNKKEND